MKKRMQKIQKSRKVFDEHSEEERYKRYKHVQYRNLVLKSTLTFVVGVLLAFIFKL